MDQYKKKSEENYPFFYGFEAMTFVDNILWTVAISFNGLIKIDLETRIMELVTQIPGEDLFGIRLYGDILHYRNKLILIPMSAKEIAIFDIDSYEFKKIPIDVSMGTKSKLYKNDCKFCKGILYDNYVYLLSCSFPAIIKMDLFHYRTKYIDAGFDVLDNIITNMEDVYFRNYYFDQRNSVWMASCSCNRVIKFSLGEDTYHMYEVGENDDCFSDIIRFENYFCITSKNREREIIIADSLEENKIRRIKNVGNVLSDFLMADDQKIFIFPHDGKVIEIDLQYFTAKYNDWFEQWGYEDYTILNGVKYKDCFYFFVNGSFRLMVYSMKEKLIRAILLRPANEVLRMMKRAFLLYTMKKYGVMPELDKYRLDSWLEDVIAVQCNNIDLFRKSEK